MCGTPTDLLTVRIITRFGRRIVCCKAANSSKRKVNNFSHPTPSVVAAAEGAFFILIMRNLFILIGLSLSMVIAAQPAYMNVQFDYQNRWETSGFNSIESDSFYILPINGGTPFQNVGDTSFVIKINKYTTDIIYKKIVYFEGQSVVSVLKKNNTIIINGSNFMGVKEYNNVDNNLYLAALDIESLEPLTVKEYGLTGRVDVLYRPIPTADGGFFSTGLSFKPTGRSSVVFFKCDSNLNQQYFKLYPSNPTQNYFAAGAVETPDGQILLAGSWMLPEISYFGKKYRMSAIPPICLF
jgi:hypothetical protein